MKTRGLALIVLAALATALVAAISFWSLRGSSAANGAAKTEGVRVRNDKLVRTLLVSGELAAVRAIRIMAPRFRERGSVAIKALAPEGSLVKPGDLLLQIDNASLLTSLSTEEINLEKAENDLVKKQAEQQIQIKDLEMQLAQRKLELDKAELKAEIGQELIALREWQDNQFVYQKAKKEYDKVIQTLELTRKAAGEELALVRVRRDQAMSKIKALKADLSALQIVADRTGTVLYENYPMMNNPTDRPRKFQVGDQVWPGMPVLSVPDLSEMEVRVFISEVDGGLLRPGLRARVVADSYPGLEFSGVFEYMPELAERIRRMSNVRVFIGRIKLDRTDPKLMKPGMSVRAEVFLDELAGLLLPRAAVFEEGGKHYVLHATRGKSEVGVRGRNATSCRVEGLVEGDVVLVPGS